LLQYARALLEGATGPELQTLETEGQKSGRIAVKVINHLGDEVMKVFRVE
jgi:hypothetical protein